MQKLDQEIICHECKTSHMTVPEEDDDEAPVHCCECGAFMCLWRDLAVTSMLIAKKA
ncbi:hypothetical protein [Phyllobacterium sp. K27]